MIPTVVWDISVKYEGQYKSSRTVAYIVVIDARREKGAFRLASCASAKTLISEGNSAPPIITASTPSAGDVS